MRRLIAWLERIAGVTIETEETFVDFLGEIG